MRKYWLVVVTLILAVMLIGLAVALSVRNPPPSTAAMQMPEATEDPRREMLLAADPGLQAGQEQYNLRCVHCHGYDGEGAIQISAVDTLALGMKVVPSHDRTGHTWMHPEQLLVQLIKQGVPNLLYRFQMPAYGEVMTEDEIRQVLAYISLWWTDSQRQHYQALTEARTALEAQFPVADEQALFLRQRGTRIRRRTPTCAMRGEIRLTASATPSCTVVSQRGQTRQSAFIGAKSPGRQHRAGIWPRTTG